VVNSRAKLKRAAPLIARYSGISRALALRYAGAGVIFGLHSISGNGASGPDDFLSIPIRALQRTLCWLRDNGIEVVSLDEAIKRLDGSSADKFCVFTFDDGYADNLTHALPIMESFDAPFTVYVTTGMLTGEIDAWWLGLATLISARDYVELPALGCSFYCNDPASKKRAFVAISVLIDTNPEALEVVRTAITASGIDCRMLARAAGLNTEQLRRLAASPLVTIGAHGIRHIKLAFASAAEVEQEMAASRRVLEDIIEREVMHFAYPFGACGPREAQIAKSLGFRTAVTTQRGTLFAEHLSHLYALPREPVSRYESPSSLRCKVDGTYRAFYSRFGNPMAHL
jgi:peptidoglycan/xylan/chitin deacetylase (PgdA/CDA1 family)